MIRKNVDIIRLTIYTLLILMLIVNVSCLREEREIIPYLFDTEGGKYGYADRNGNVIIEPRYDFADQFSEGFARVQLNEKWNYLYRRDRFYYELFAGCGEAINLKGEWGFIDKTGKMVILLLFYSEVGNFSEGLAPIKSTKWGYINKDWEEVIPMQYDECQAFSGDLAAVKLNGKWGYIDKQGNEVIPPKYDDIFHHFLNGLAHVAINSEQRWIDKYGNEYLSEIEYSLLNRIN